MPLFQSFGTSGVQATNNRRWHYCPCCGTPFVSHPLQPFERQQCANCGSIHYLNPFPGIAILLHSSDGRVLIGKRAKEVRYGSRWCLPGGYIEYEESFLAAAHRETREETGLKIRVQGIVNVVSNHLDDCRHTLVIVLIGVVIGGRQVPGDDLVELRWIDQEEHRRISYAFAADQQSIDGFFAGNLQMVSSDGSR